MIFRRNIVNFTDFSAQENIPTDYSSKNQSCSIVSSKPNSDYNVYLITFIIINKSNIFKRNNVHFSAQETPGEEIPTDLHVEKAKLLCCFRLAKQ